MTIKKSACHFIEEIGRNNSKMDEHNLVQGELAKRKTRLQLKRAADDTR